MPEWWWENEKFPSLYIQHLQNNIQSNHIKSLSSSTASTHDTSVNHSIRDTMLDLLLFQKVNSLELQGYINKKKKI